MLTYNEALTLISDSFASLQRSGVIPETIIFSPDTVILGIGSELDSLGFVTFISDLEERLCEETSQDLYLVLNDIDDFNINSPFLAAGTIARYVEKLTQAPAN